MKAAEILKLDPELEHLLAELAAEPESSLLRVARPAVLPALFESGSIVSQNATGLLPVERELLRAHRAELAEVLLDLCRQRLMTEDRYLLFVTGVPYGTASSGQPQSKEAFLQRLVPVLGQELDHETQTVANLVAACMTTPLSGRPSIPKLAAASLRLKPTWAAMANSAIAIAVDGQPRTALRVFSRILEQSTGATNQANAWQSIGIAQSFMGNTREMTLAYERSFDIQPDRPTALLSRLVGSLFLGDSDSVNWCSKVATELSLHEHQTTHRYLAALRARARSGEWKLEIQQKSAIAAIARRSGILVERFANAIAAQ